jgi:hypothetical protein
MTALFDTMPPLPTSEFFILVDAVLDVAPLPSAMFIDCCTLALFRDLPSILDSAKLTEALNNKTTITGIIYFTTTPPLHYYY